MADALGQAFVDECVALDGLVSALTTDDFARPTQFYGWTVRDEIMHLMFLDEVTLCASQAEGEFLTQLAEIRRYQAEVGELSDYMRERYAGLDADQLIGIWRRTFVRLGARFAASDAKARMKWFGPDMSLRSAAAARQMEVWAHGQDLYDLFGVERENDDRIRNICELGARTFGWSFQNRGLQPPAAAPRVELVAPSGAVWRWNAEASHSSLTGAAVDFALVVTQRRHVEDTALVARGEAAVRWMRIAQCFAGAPSDGPAPGVRSMRSREAIDAP